MSEIRVDSFKAEDGISAPSFPNGIQVTGVVTATVLDTSVDTLNVTGGHVNVGTNIQLGDAGVVTATTFKGNIEGTTGTFSGNVSVGGTLTYEDVTNIDSVGLITARSGISVSGGVITAQAGENKIPALYANMAALPNAGTYHGMFAHVHATGRGYFAHGGGWYELVNKELNGVVGTGTENYNVGVVTATSFVDGGTNLLTEINTKASTGKAIAMAMIFG